MTAVSQPSHSSIKFAGRPLQRRLVGLAALACWLMSGIAWSAEDPEIEAAISAEEIYVGESVDLQVEIRNSKNPSAPDLSAVKQQFDVTANGDESRNQSSTYIINGRVTQQNIFSHVYHFRLTPKVAGKLIIPAMTASIDGKTLTTSPIPLKVIEAEKQDLVLIETEASLTTVYPTQPFSILLRILVQPLPNVGDRDPLTPLRRQPPHLQINWADPPNGLTTEEKSRWLQPLLADDGVGFTLNDVSTRTGSFFDGPRAAVFNLAKGRETRNALDGKPIRYFVYELTRTFTPEKAGEFSFGPATVKGMFVTGIERSEYTPRRLVASSSAVTVEVREVPSPRPATYCGGIGEYHAKAAASPMKLRVGDPLTLTIEFERGHQSGSLDLVSAPDLSTIPSLSNDFDLIDKNPTGRVDGMVKRFSYAMRPKHPNVTIPALTLHTFDPQKEEFVAIKTAAIPIEVSEAARVTAGDLVGSMPSNGSAEIKSRAQGIFQNITDPAEVRDERVNVIAWSEVTLGFWCAAGCLIAVVTAYRRKSSDAVWVRRQQARRMASSRLAEARKLLAEGQSVESLRLVRTAIIGLVADTRNRIADGLTTADVDACLTTASVPDAQRVSVLALLESIESAEYGAAKSADAAMAIESAASLIAQVSPYLEQGS